jgi:hypothetical protein
MACLSRIEPMFLSTNRAEDDIVLAAGWDMAITAAGQFADAAEARQRAGR